MMSSVWLLMLLCGAVCVNAQRDPGSGDDDHGDKPDGDKDTLHGRFPWPLPGSKAPSHYCPSYTNVMRMERVNVCPPGTNCVRNLCPQKCTGGRWWWSRCKYDCPSCCDTPMTRVYNVTKQVCCCGYSGFLCREPVCSTPCADNTTTCTAPDTCGPACYPACQYGTCVTSGNGNNTCQCDVGFSGQSCSQRVQCSDSMACLNGGTCVGGRCLCAANYQGVLCDKPFRK